MPHHRRLPPPGPLNRPLKARTPARPDGAILKPPAPAAGGFSLSNVAEAEQGPPEPRVRPRALDGRRSGACNVAAAEQGPPEPGVRRRARDGRRSGGETP